VHVGIVQMSLHPDLQNNSQKILSYIVHANRRKIDLLCFPECALTGYNVDHHKIRMDDVRKGISKLQKASYKYGISLIVGTSWSRDRNDNETRKIYNALQIGFYM
jgi:omega-amidase